MDSPAPDLLAPFPILETERLVLRRIRKDDAGALFAIFSDPLATKYWGSAPFTSLAEAQAQVARAEAVYDERRGIEWAVTLRDDDRLIGKVNHHKWMREHARSEIGYAIRPDHWRRGIVTEAMRAVLAFGFDVLGLHSVEAQLDPLNVASRATLERLGFVLEGHLRENYRYFDGHFADTLIFSLLESNRPKAV